MTYESIREWCQKFGQQYANQLRHKRSYVTGKGHTKPAIAKKKPKLVPGLLDPDRALILETETTRTIVAITASTSCDQKLIHPVMRKVVAMRRMAGGRE